MMTVDCAMNVVVKFVRFTALKCVQHGGYLRFLLILVNKKKLLLNFKMCP